MKNSKTRTRGFTLIELVVVIAIIVILAGLLLERVWFYQEQAEKAAMEQVAGALQTALILQYANLLTHGRESEAKTLTTENPLRWLLQKPANYAGEFYDLTPASITPGNWAFDLKSRELVYVPYRAEYFTPGADGNKWVRYHARLDYDVRVLPAKGGKPPASEQTLAGIVFEPVTPFQWLGMK